MKQSFLRVVDERPDGRRRACDRMRRRGVDACAREAGKMFLLVQKYAIGRDRLALSAVDRRRGWRLQLPARWQKHVIHKLGGVCARKGGVCARTWGSLSTNLGEFVHKLWGSRAKSSEELWQSLYVDFGEVSWGALAKVACEGRSFQGCHPGCDTCQSSLRRTFSDTPRCTQCERSKP